jgi:Cof subfamily protein (haloacid dehalogenase superfamily)
MFPRLIALDLDGTLLPRSKILTERSRRAVRSARESGAEVVLATGKTFHLAARYAEELGLSGPVIALDGALVRDWPSEETQASWTVPPGRVRVALEALDGLDLRPFIADGGDRLVVHEDLEPWTGLLRVYAERIHVTSRPESSLDGDPHLLAFLGPERAAEEGRRRLAKLDEDGLQVFFEAMPHRDVSLLSLSPRVDKGAALREVAAWMGVPREEVAAVGDWRNDVGMIEWAGTGLAMAGADPEVVAVADAVLPGSSEEDGVAAWLEELFPG